MINGQGTLARSYRPFHFSIVGRAAALIALLAANAAWAVDRTWINPAGGTFDAPANWQGGIAPSTSDTANFNLDSAVPYTVTLSASRTVTEMLLDQGRMLLDLSGFTLTTTLTGSTTPSLLIAQTAGVAGNLELRNGTLATTDVRVGDYGAGTVTLSNGAKIISTGSAYYGFRDGSAATINLSGAGTSWTAGSHQIGSRGDASVNISDGAALITTQEVSAVGGTASSHGLVTVTGPGSSWTGAAEYILAGGSGHGTLIVNDRGFVSAKAMNIASDVGGVGIVNLDGATTAGRSTIAISGAVDAGVAVGQRGMGTLNISNGSLFTDGSTFWLGYQPGASGTVNVSGAAAGNNAELRIGGALQMARSIASNPSAGGGMGTLTIGTGGSVTVSGTTYLGSTGTAPGTGTITLNGGTFTAHGITASAGSGVVFNAGTFILNGGAYTPASGTLALVGATASDNATLKFTNSATMNLSGALSVGGSAVAAGPGTGLLSVESGSTVTFAGSTTLWTGGTLNVAGGTFKTASVVQAGGTLNFTSGGLYLTGSNFTLGNAGLLGPTLTLASGAGNRNTLSVSGTTTLDPGSSLTINGGSFSTGKLANNGGAISFGTGSFSITNDNFTIGAASPVGATLDLTAGRSLSVSGVVTIDAGASLTLNGGSFSASSLVNNGTFNFISGTLGGSSDLIIDPGQLLGANLALGAGRNLTGSQGLLVGKTGTATMTVTGGGTATSARGYIGQLAGSSGTVSITGSGSKWTLSSTLAVGGSDSAAGGAASLTVSSGGKVSAASTVKIYPSAVVKIDAATFSGSSIANQGQLELANASTISGALTNTGTLNKTGVGTTTLNGTLNNNATVQVLGGTLKLGSGAGVSAGSFSVAGGATLDFAGSFGTNANSTLAASSSLSGAGTAVFSNGYHVINTAVTVANLSIGNGSPEFNVNSTTTHLSIIAPNPTVNQGLFVNKVLDVQTVDMSSGTLRGTGVVNVAAAINFTGTALKSVYDATVNASGYTLWTDGGSVGMSKATFNNLAGATFEAKHLTAGPPIVFGGGNSVFNNYGNFVESGGDFYVQIKSAFNNSGTVDLQKGSLQLTGGGTSSGSFTGAAGTNLVIGDQTTALTTFLPASSIMTAGNVQFQGTPINFSGHLNVAGTTNIINANFLAGADLQSLGSALIVNGTATFTTGLPQALPTTTLNYELARIGGTDDLTTAAPFTWVGGYLSTTGHVRLNGGGTLTSTSQKSLTAGVLDNAGLLVWSGGTFNQRATFNNLSGATLDIRGSDAMEIDLSAPGPIFSNAGALIKSAGNTTVIYPQFNNTGSVEVQAGMLVFGRDSSSSGSYTVAKGAGLVFTFGTHGFASSSSITGDGDVQFNESPVSFAGSYAVTGSTTVGSSTASGTTTPVTFQPGSSATELGRLVTINTYGTLTLNTGKTVTLHDLTVWGNLTGTDKVIIDGQVTGRGSIQAEVINAGTFSPGASPGTLQVKGNYTQDPAASLKVEIAAPGSVGTKYVQRFDVLNVTGAAHLAGTLDLSMLDGAVPANGESFRILTTSARSGQFDRYLGLVLGSGSASNRVRYATPAYDATGVTLRVGERLLGDATLDGATDFNDLAKLAQNYNAVVTGGDPWLAGDFTGDGSVDFLDLAKLAQNYNTSLPAAPIPGAAAGFEADLARAFATVPEPNALAFPAIGAISMLVCRRRRRTA
jgi:T5SS/PEP-CTERM-associated repeat protein